MTLPNSIDIEEKLAQIDAYWTPHIVAELNGQYVKLAKLKGEFIWHSHEQEDEMFLVIKGNLQIKFRTHQIVIGPGQFAVVPKGIEHLPIAEEEVHVMLFEPMSTLNTGDKVEARTKTDLKKI